MILILSYCNTLLRFHQGERWINVVYSTLLSCSDDDPQREFTVVVDRRTSNWTNVRDIIRRLTVSERRESHFSDVNFVQTPIPLTLSHVYVLKPKGLLQRLFVERSMTSIRDYCPRCPVSFLDSAEELFPFIEPNNLPADLGGQMTVDVEQWITDRMV